MVINVIQANFGDITYNILFDDIGQAHGTAFIHIISSFSIILMVYIIGHYVTPFFSEKSFVFKIGGNTFSIMVWHLTMYWLVNLIFYRFSLIKFGDLSNVYFNLIPDKTWFIYVFAGIFGSIGIAEAYRLVLRKVNLSIVGIQNPKLPATRRKLPKAS